MQPIQNKDIEFTLEDANAVLNGDFSRKEKIKNKHEDYTINKSTIFSKFWMHVIIVPVVVCLGFFIMRYLKNRYGSSKNSAGNKKNISYSKI